MFALILIWHCLFKCKFICFELLNAYHSVHQHIYTYGVHVCIWLSRFMHVCVLLVHIMCVPCNGVLWLKFTVFFQFYPHVTLRKNLWQKLELSSLPGKSTLGIPVSISRKLLLQIDHEVGFYFMSWFGAFTTLVFMLVRKYFSWWAICPTPQHFSFFWAVFRNEIRLLILNSLKQLLEIWLIIQWYFGKFGRHVALLNNVDARPHVVLLLLNILQMFHQIFHYKAHMFE